MLGVSLAVSLAVASLALLRLGESGAARPAYRCWALDRGPGPGHGWASGGAHAHADDGAQRERRDGVIALQRGEELRAQLEQQGRTARREAQERLALIDALFRATPAGLALFDRDLNYVRINQGLSDMHGHARRGSSGQAPTSASARAGGHGGATLRDVLVSGEARTIELSGTTASSVSRELGWSTARPCETRKRTSWAWPRSCWTSRSARRRSTRRASSWRPCVPSARSSTWCTAWDSDWRRSSMSGAWRRPWPIPRLS